MSFTDIEQFLPKNEYDAAVNSASPSAANPFATMADLASAGGETLAQTLVLGNTTGGTDLAISASDSIVGANYTITDNWLTSGEPGVLVTGAADTFSVGKALTSFYSYTDSSAQFVILNTTTDPSLQLNDGANSGTFLMTGVSGNVSYTVPNGSGTLIVNGVATSGDILLGNGFDLTYTSGSFTNNIRTELLSGNQTLDFPDASGVLARTVDTLQGGDQALPVGTRTITLGGNVSTDNLILETNGGTTLLNIRGDKSFFIGNNVSTDHRITATDEGALAIRAGITGKTNMGSLVWNTGSTQTQFFSDNWVDATTQANSTYWRFTGKNSSGTSQPVYVGANGGVHVITGTLETHGTTASNFIAIQNGTAPTTDRVDKAVIYAADEAAGNSCIHVRTEQGEIIKLYQEAALTAENSTATDGTIGTNDTITNNIRTRLGELEARIQGHGLIA